jgi:hypothetical protein
MNMTRHQTSTLPQKAAVTSIGLASLLGTLTGCTARAEPANGADPIEYPDLGVSAAAVQTATAGLSADASETARIQRYLDSQYTVQDVRYSFVTKFGEDIDCIDFEAQPGVKERRARGLPVTMPTTQPMPPAGFPPSRSVGGTNPLADVAFNGQLDVHGNPRRCPPASVPVVRRTVSEIQQAGGLDAYLARGRNVKKGKPKDSSDSAPAPDEPGLLHVVTEQVASQQVLSTGAYLAIFDPSIGLANHSLAETWTIDGARSQTVEVGWIVQPEYNSGTSAYLFIYATNDDYATTGCYDNNPNTPNTCLTWIGNTQAAYAPGMLLATTDTLSGDLGVMTAYEPDFQVPGWSIWIDFDGGSGWTLIGGYPGDDFSGSFASGTASELDVGGEVAGVSSGNGQYNYSNVEMGSGRCGEVGYSTAAYVHDYGYYNGSAWLVPQLTPVIEDTNVPPRYDGSTKPKRAINSWTNYFYFGGNGQPVCKP